MWWGVVRARVKYFGMRMEWEEVRWSGVGWSGSRNWHKDMSGKGVGLLSIVWGVGLLSIGGELCKIMRI